MGSIHAAGAPGNGSDQVTYLQHKLQVLELQLEERDLELQEVRMQAANERAAAGRSAPSLSSRDSIASDVRDAKLKELASKSKQSTMALGREKAHSAQQAAELAALRQQLKARDDKAACGGNGEGGSAGGPPSPNRELKEVQQRLAEANKRLSEQQVGHDAVKSELAKYRRALEREVGSAEGVTKLLEGSSGARDFASPHATPSIPRSRRLKGGVHSPDILCLPPDHPRRRPRQGRHPMTPEASRRRPRRSPSDSLHESHTPPASRV
jgi:hypothetical protein